MSEGFSADFALSQRGEATQARGSGAEESLSAGEQERPAAPLLGPAPEVTPADRNLLFGILALQMDFIDRDQLVAAMNAWVLEKSQPLSQVLLRLGALQADEAQLLSAVVERHLRRHAGQAGQCLGRAALSDEVQEALFQLQDGDVDHSLQRMSRPPLSGSGQSSTVLHVPAVAIAGERRYRILRLHDGGGLGQVFLALDHELHREVALKNIRPKYADDPERRARFIVEAEITGGLEHPGIVPIYSLGQHANGRPFYAMRFIRGESLADAIARFHGAQYENPRDRTLELRRLLGRFVSICQAIEYAHSRGVIHRDIKPKNVMLGQHGETLVVDWGLAKVVGRPETHRHLSEPTLAPSSGGGSTPTQAGSIIGTPPYMSPEQAAGKLEELGPASDVYSLGATLYALLTGKPAFDGKDPEVLDKVQRGEFPPPRAASPQVAESLEAICLKAMALRAEDRYPSARHLADAIEASLADQPLDAYQREVQRMRRWAEADPDDLKGRKGLARSLINLGIMLHALGRYEEADHDLGEGVALWRAIVDEPDLSLADHESLANAHLHHSRTLLALHREKEAREAHAAALDEYRTLLRLRPNTSHYEVMCKELYDTLATFEEPPSVEERHAPSAPRKARAAATFASAAPRRSRWWRLWPFRRRDDRGVAPPPPAAADRPVELEKASPSEGEGLLASLTASPTTDAAEQRIGPYQVIRKLGQGSLGAVYLAEHVNLRRSVVIKQVPKHVAHVVNREAQVLAQLTHPNIVAVYDCGQLSDGSGYLVSEYVEGETLRDRLRDANRNDSNEVRELLRMFVQICEALAYGHAKNVVHGDVKPANVLVSKDGGVKVADWALAKINAASGAAIQATSTLMGTFLGTPAYVAPEQIWGDLASVGPRTDIYALGGILFEILTGQPANLVGGGASFGEIVSRVCSSPPPRACSLDASVPEALDAVCLKALARDPAERYASASLLADEVRRWLASE